MLNQWPESDTLQDQTQEVERIAKLIHSLASIDSVALHFFVQQYVPDPKYLFLKIIQQKIPHRKETQEALICLLAYCYYRIVNLKQQSRNEQEMIEKCFRQYLKVSPFLPDLVKYHELMKKWVDSLLVSKDIISARRELAILTQSVQNSPEPKLQIMNWRLSLCLLILDSVISKTQVERSRVLKIVKGYKMLKKLSKISVNPTIQAFSFLISQLLTRKSDLYLYFEMELKQLKKEPLEDPMYDIIEETLKKCEEFSTKKVVSAVNVFIKQKIPVRKYPEKHDQRFKKIWHNEQINQNILRKVDHFLRFRPPITTRSLGATPRASISLHNEIARTPPSLHETTRLGWFKSTTKIKNQQSCASLSRTTGVFPRKKRREIYKSICKDKESEKMTIRENNLRDELYEIESVAEERCKLTFDQILLGELTDLQKKDEPSVKTVGALEDRDFGSLRLSFYSIFNQELAQLLVIITKKAKNYLVQCYITSTYCRQSSKMVIQNSKKSLEDSLLSDEITVDTFYAYVQSSIIFYEALQQRLQRKVSIKEMQVMEQMIREKMHQALSHQQLEKVIMAVDLAKTQFFWYYTKSSLINGSRIEKRKMKISLEDESAFAVCLSKFKSDYDSCLKELIEVENMTSLMETCEYLSHGRLVVYRQFRQVKGRLYLEVITISESVYKSFKRRGKLPFFQRTTVDRVLLDLSGERNKKLKRSQVDLRCFLKEEEIFTFFMKNIVQNFIEIKYLQKFCLFLQRKHNQQNENSLEEKYIKNLPAYNIECVNNNEIQESLEGKPSLNGVLSNLCQSLLAYTQAFNLKPEFQIKQEQHHLLRIGSKSYFGHEIELKNGLKLVKIFKSKSRSTYQLFFYHQHPQLLTIVPTPFHNRIAFVPELSSSCFRVNLIRNFSPQEFTVNDTPSPLKMVIRLNNKYCYACISESQSLLNWRLDLYLPEKQIHYATFLDEEIYFECLSRWNKIGEDVWKKALAFAQLNLKAKIILIGSQYFKLFQVFKKMVISHSQILAGVELIEHQNQLYYLITHFNQGTLSLGRIDDIPVAFSGQLFGSNSTSSRAKLSVYSNLMTRLYYQLISGIVPSELISPDFFKSSLNV